MKRFTILTKKACNYFTYDEQAGKVESGNENEVVKEVFYKIILAPALSFLVSLHCLSISCFHLENGKG